ncbi:hypothetical protein ACFLZJ_01475 [Nanoarchaeota archaeon]
MIGVIVFLAIMIIFIIVASLYHIVPWFFGAVFERTQPKTVNNIIILTKPKKQDKIAELGSGDGEVVIALAKKGAKVDGYEINPILVFISRYRIKKQGLSGNAKIYWKSFWGVNLSKYNKIVFFQYKTIMQELEEKLKKELKLKSLIISHYWKFPNWKIKKKIGQVYLYKK